MAHLLDNLKSALRQARQEKGLTQRALSEAAGLPQSHISKIENGPQDISLSTLVTLARALDLELTLVPKKAVPAVESIIESVRPVPKLEIKPHSFRHVFGAGGLKEALSGPFAEQEKSSTPKYRGDDDDK